MVQHDLPKLPTLIASSVVRSSHQGESHGGVYLVDMAEDRFEQVIDWNDASIDWEGRGADRGLRGIAFYNGLIYLAASNEIFVYDKNFILIESFTNPYLRHCHEIYIYDNTLLLSSTGFDSVLVYDLLTKEFISAYCLRSADGQTNLQFNCYNPNREQGPTAGDTIHINSVYYLNNCIFVSSRKVPFLMYITKENNLMRYAVLARGSHNAHPFLDGVLLNDTANDRVLHTDKDGVALNSFSVICYPDDKLTMSHLPKDHARQSFARGLCVSNDGWILSGSSPSTISAYRLGSADALKTFNITMDVRNSIHGLEIWPF